MRYVDALRTGRAMTRPAFAVLGLALAMLAPGGLARAEPPITSAEDAACREVARARVYSVPDPLNLGLREIGRRIYSACMSRNMSRGPGRRRYRSQR